MLGVAWDGEMVLILYRLGKDFYLHSPKYKKTNIQIVSITMVTLLLWLYCSAESILCRSLENLCCMTTYFGVHV